MNEKRLKPARKSKRHHQPQSSSPRSSNQRKQIAKDQDLSQQLEKILRDQQIKELLRGLFARRQGAPAEATTSAEEPSSLSRVPPANPSPPFLTDEEEQDRRGDTTAIPTTATTSSPLDDECSLGRTNRSSSPSNNKYTHLVRNLAVRLKSQNMGTEASKPDGTPVVVAPEEEEEEVQVTTTNSPVPSSPQDGESSPLPSRRKARRSSDRRRSSAKESLSSPSEILTEDNLRRSQPQSDSSSPRRHALPTTTADDQQSLEDLMASASCDVQIPSPRAPRSAEKAKRRRRKSDSSRKQTTPETTTSSPKRTRSRPDPPTVDAAFPSTDFMEEPAEYLLGWQSDHVRSNSIYLDARQDLEDESLAQEAHVEVVWEEGLTTLPDHLTKSPPASPVSRRSSRRRSKRSAQHESTVDIVPQIIEEQPDMVQESPGNGSTAAQASYGAVRPSPYKPWNDGRSPMMSPTQRSTPPQSDNEDESVRNLPAPGIWKPSDDDDNDHTQYESSHEQEHEASKPSDGDDNDHTQYESSHEQEHEASSTDQVAQGNSTEHPAEGERPASVAKQVESSPTATSSHPLVSSVTTASALSMRVEPALQALKAVGLIKGDTADTLVLSASRLSAANEPDNGASPKDMLPPGTIRGSVMESSAVRQSASNEEDAKESEGRDNGEVTPSPFDTSADESQWIDINTPKSIQDDVASATENRVSVSSGNDDNSEESEGGDDEALIAAPLDASPLDASVGDYPGIETNIPIDNHDGVDSTNEQGCSTSSDSDGQGEGQPPESLPASGSINDGAESKENELSTSSSYDTAQSKQDSLLDSHDGQKSEGGSSIRSASNGDGTQAMSLLDDSDGHMVVHGNADSLVALDESRSSDKQIVSSPPPTLQSNEIPPSLSSDESERESSELAENRDSQGPADRERSPIFNFQPGYFVEENQLVADVHFEDVMFCADLSTPRASAILDQSAVAQVIAEDDMEALVSTPVRSPDPEPPLYDKVEDETNQQTSVPMPNEVVHLSSESVADVLHQQNPFLDGAEEIVFCADVSTPRASEILDESAIAPLLVEEEFLTRTASLEETSIPVLVDGNNAVAEITQLGLITDETARVLVEATSGFSVEKHDSRLEEASPPASASVDSQTTATPVASDELSAVAAITKAGVITDETARVLVETTSSLIVDQDLPRDENSLPAAAVADDQSMLPSESPLPGLPGQLAALEKAMDGTAKEQNEPIEPITSIDDSITLRENDALETHGQGPNDIATEERDGGLSESQHTTSPDDTSTSEPAKAKMDPVNMAHESLTRTESAVDVTTVDSWKRVVDQARLKLSEASTTKVSEEDSDEVVQSVMEMALPPSESVDAGETALVPDSEPTLGESFASCESPSACSSPKREQVHLERGDEVKIASPAEPDEEEEDTPAIEKAVEMHAEASVGSPMSAKLASEAPLVDTSTESPSAETQSPASCSNPTADAASSRDLPGATPPVTSSASRAVEQPDVEPAPVPETESLQRDDISGVEPAFNAQVSSDQDAQCVTDSIEPTALPPLERVAVPDIVKSPENTPATKHETITESPDVPSLVQVVDAKQEPLENDTLSPPTTDVPNDSSARHTAHFLEREKDTGSPPAVTDSPPPAESRLFAQRQLDTASDKEHSASSPQEPSAPLPPKAPNHSQPSLKNLNSFITDSTASAPVKKKEDFSTRSAANTSPSSDSDDTRFPPPNNAQDHEQPPASSSPSGNVSLAESSITEASQASQPNSCEFRVKPVFSPTATVFRRQNSSPSSLINYKPRPMRDLLRKDLRSADEAVVERALQQITIDCFYDQSYRSLIARSGGLLSVITAMEDHPENARIQIAACQALEKLALDAENERAVAELGGIDCILGAMMSHFDNLRVQESAWSALQNLTCSNALTEMTFDTTEGGMMVLVDAFSQHAASNSGIAQHASATLANLCIPNVERTEQVVAANGVVLLAQALQQHWSDKDARAEISHSLERLCESIAGRNE